MALKGAYTVRPLITLWVLKGLCPCKALDDVIEVCACSSWSLKRLCRGLCYKGFNALGEAHAPKRLFINGLMGA